MMSNAFSTFDPATSMTLSLNWMSSILVLFMIPPMYWIIWMKYWNA